MRGRILCYYHYKASAKPEARPQTMPNLEDGESIQLGIATVLRRLFMCDIEYKAATSMLYAYQLAMINLRNMHAHVVNSSKMVTVDPIADPEHAGDATEPLTIVEMLANDRNTIPAAVAATQETEQTESMDTAAQGPQQEAQKLLPRSSGKFSRDMQLLRDLEGIKPNADNELSEKDFAAVLATVARLATG